MGQYYKSTAHGPLHLHLRVQCIPQGAEACQHGPAHPRIFTVAVQVRVPSHTDRGSTGLIDNHGLQGIAVGDPRLD